MAENRFRDDCELDSPREVCEWPVTPLDFVPEFEWKESSSPSRLFQHYIGMLFFKRGESGRGNICLFESKLLQFFDSAEEL